MRKIKFVDYTGYSPFLCYGKLILSVDGEEMTVNCELLSGGHWWMDEDGGGTDNGS